MGYKHLNIDERESILKMLSEQKNMTDIAELIGRNKGTISRELSRNLSSTGEYKPHLAQRYYSKRRDASKQPYRLEQDSKLRRYVRRKLKRYWSPEQIAGRLNRDRKIDVSPVTIYCWIMRDKAEGGRLYKYLRQSNRKRRKRYGSCEKRGTNENTNGLLRQFFPKGTDFHQVSQWLLDKVEKLLNNLPRKCLNYRTPAEVFWRGKVRCASG